MKHLKKFESRKWSSGGINTEEDLEEIDFENISDILSDIKDDFEIEEYRVYWYDEDLCRDLGIECKNKYIGGINIRIARSLESDDESEFGNRLKETISRLRSEYIVYNSKTQVDGLLYFGISIPRKKLD